MGYFSRIFRVLSNKTESKSEVKIPEIKETLDDKPDAEKQEEKTKGLEGLVMHKILNDVFKKMGAKPTFVGVPVLMHKGDEYKDIYTIPETRDFYGDEATARRHLQPDQTLYAVTVRRIE